MLQRVNIAFGMWHQAEDGALRITYTCDIAERAIGVGGIAYLAGGLLTGRRVDQWHLPACLQVADLTSKDETPLAMRHRQFDRPFNTLRKDTGAGKRAQCNPAAFKAGR